MQNKFRAPLFNVYGVAPLAIDEINNDIGLRYVKNYR